MEDKISEPKWLLIAGAILGVVVLWAGLGYLALMQPDPGVFGDMFGAANALFSGLAFAGLIYAIWLQRVELKLQREELAATRAELKGQKEQLEAQNSTLRKQSFENTFFQLLRLHNDIVSAIDLVKPGEGSRITKGRDCFKVFLSRLRGEYESDKRARANPGMATIHGLNEVYMRFYQQHEAELGHYFRSLYNTIKLVDESDVEDKRLYTNLVRAQLSSYELLLMFYDSLSEMGREKFKPLIVEYELLKHLQTKELRGGLAFLDTKSGRHKWTNCSIVTAMMPIERSRHHETVTQEPLIEVQGPHRPGGIAGRSHARRACLTPRRTRHPDRCLAQAAA